MIHQSQLPLVDIPDLGIHQLLLGALGTGPERPSMIDAHSGKTVTNRELHDQILRVAGGLAARGFGRGDALALIAPNCLEYPVVVIAAAALGGRAALPNPLGTVDDFASQIDRTKARFVVTVPGLLDKVGPAAKRAGCAEVFVIGSADGATPFAALLDHQPIGSVAEVHANDLVALPFSSGTSGRPKAVMLSHRNLVAQMVQFAAGMPVADGTRILAVLPFFHIYGLVLILLTSLWRGRPIVVMQKFELDGFLDAIARHRVELAPVVPPIMVALAKHPKLEQLDLGSLKYIMAGAAPLSAAIEEQVARRLKVVVVQGYGMTEVSGASHLNQLAPETIRSGSVGVLVPNMELRIVDPTSERALGVDARGELWVRGPNVFAGYLDDSEATSQTLTPDGWLKTGDIGYVDSDGYYYIVDRLKELIKYKAHQVAPADLEAVLLAHPHIADAAVIPSADPEAGEVPKAFVVLKAPLTAQEIMDYVATKVAAFERVRRVEIVDSIPKSPSGKILRRVLVERERSRLGG